MPYPTSTRPSPSTLTPLRLRHDGASPGDQPGAGRAEGDDRRRGHRAIIQLLTLLGDSSTIAKLRDRSGPGLQQLAYGVTDA